MQAEAESLSFISHKFIDTASSRGRLVLDDSAGLTEKPSSSHNSQ
jgi:hypothetical protein